MGSKVRFSLVLGVLALAASGATFTSAAGAAPTPATAPNGAETSLERDVVAQINAFRAARSLPKLALSPSLSRVALTHTMAMGRFGFFAHESRDGSPFWKRIKRAYDSTGYSTWTVGENLLWSTDVDAPGALALWAASPAHLKNLLDPRWRQIGISALRVPAAPGVYGARDVTIITTDFGRRIK
jgi:uncharacterized protein YkwD